MELKYKISDTSERFVYYNHFLPFMILVFVSV